MTATPGFSRRKALTGAAALGIAVPTLAACGDEPAGDSADPSSAPDTPGSSTASPDAGSSAPAGEGFTATSDIPVGGGKIFKDEKVVVTQPTEGEFKCFTAICTHQGCTVTEVNTEVIHCNCHGSEFSISDGSNTQGPNGDPAGSVGNLAEVGIAVEGDQIALT